MNRLAVLFGALVLVGCVDPEMDPNGPTGPGGGKEDDPTATSPLAASYALELHSVMQLEDGRETGDARFSTYDLRARARATVTVGQEGAVTMTVRLCDVKLPEVSGYQPQLAAAFVTAIPAITVKGTLVDGMLTTDPAAIVLGAKLTNPLTSALPTDGADAKVRDQDQDGNPGVSIEVPGYGRIFAALRVKLSLEAAVEASATIEGAADIAMDQAIYGDDIWFYDAATSAAETSANVTVVSADNTFAMKSGATTCAQVRTKFPD